MGLRTATFMPGILAAAAGGVAIRKRRMRQTSDGAGRQSGRLQPAFKMRAWVILRIGLSLDDPKALDGAARHGGFALAKRQAIRRDLNLRMRVDSQNLRQDAADAPGQLERLGLLAADLGLEHAPAQMQALL